MAETPTNLPNAQAPQISPANAPATDKPATPPVNKLVTDYKAKNKPADSSPAGVSPAEAILNKLKTSLGDEANILQAFEVKPLDASSIQLTTPGHAPIGVRFNGSVPIFFVANKKPDTINTLGEALHLAENPAPAPTK